MAHKAPCPFCHFTTSRVLAAVIGEVEEGITGYYVACGNCGARGPLVIPDGIVCGDDGAISCWNMGQSKEPTLVIVQKIRTDVERLGAAFNNPNLWQRDPKLWTRFELEEAADMLCRLRLRGFNCTLEVAP